MRFSLAYGTTPTKSLLLSIVFLLVLCAYRAFSRVVQVVTFATVTLAGSRTRAETRSRVEAERMMAGQALRALLMPLVRTRLAAPSAT